MPRWCPNFCLVFALLCSPALAEKPSSAVKTSGSATATAPVASLTPEQINNASREDAISVPSPGELLAALNKEGKPNWQSQYRQPIPTAYSSRPQIALNLGGLIADGYIAIEAEDSQQVKNIGRDIITLAKTLNVSENVLRRGKSIEEFADNNEWNTLKEELEATQNEVKLTMNEQQDRDLIILVTLGGWIRGTEVVSGWIADNYTPKAAKLLRQPSVVNLLQNGIEKLPERLQGDPLIQTMKEKLAQIERMVSFPMEETLTVEQVRKLKELNSELIKKITTKE